MVFFFYAKTESLGARGCPLGWCSSLPEVFLPVYFNGLILYFCEIFERGIPFDNNWFFAILVRTYVFCFNDAAVVTARNWVYE